MNLEKTEAAIKAVDDKLEALDAEIRKARAAHDEDEVAALRAEKEQLGADKKQLRAMQILLIERQPGTLSLAPRTWKP